ncbi:MAG: hypothetical protein J4G14_08825 [Dehalococcoidia bacterium]|nr:hypothetical protein [Dehalococcoidia bacterium]
MTGNLVLEPTDPVFLLDESLVPAVARSLQLVGYNFVDVATAFGTKGSQDPEIIEWCGRNQAVWIHADDRARRQHRALLQTSGIRTLWIYRRRGRMTGKEQLRILAFVLILFRDWLNTRQSATTGHPPPKPSLRPVNI